MVEFVTNAGELLGSRRYFGPKLIALGINSEFTLAYGIRVDGSAVRSIVD